MDWVALVQKITSTNVSNEKDVQTLWNELMVSLVVRPNRSWSDCRAPNGLTFMGRNHDIGLVLFRGTASAMEYVDIPIELKPDISTDANKMDVVLQILDCLSFCAEAQPGRRVFWGIGMDKDTYTVVKCLPTMEYFVSPLFTIKLSEDLVKLAKLLNTDFGYVPVVLPKPFGLEVTSTIGEAIFGSVFAMSETVVLKACRSEGVVSLKRELGYLSMIQAAGLHVSPSVLSTHRGKDGDDYLLGFEMDRYQPISVSDEECLSRLMRSVFWGLAVVHASNVIHNDVKPPNILESLPGTERRYILCDFGHAYRTNENLDSRGATDKFASVPGEFVECSKDKKARDIESLYWTVFHLWAGIKEIKLLRRRNARKYIMKHGALISASYEEVPVENADVKAFLTCESLPSVASVAAAGDPGHAGITLASCPANIRRLLFPDNTN